MVSSQRIRRQRILTQAEGYLELGMPDSALETLQAWGARHGLDGRAMYLKGEALRTLSRNGEALDALQQAALALPDDIHIRLAIAWCCKRLGRIDEAIDALEHALDVSPGEPILHYNLACYFSLVGDKRRSLTHLTRALEMDEDFRELVGDEPDFDPVRDDPDFQRLTSIIV